MTVNAFLFYSLMSGVCIMRKAMVFSAFLPLLTVCLPGLAIEGASISDVNCLSENGPPYVPGQVVVKLKEKSSRQVLAGESYSDRLDRQNQTLSVLKARYKLRAERPVFRGLHKRLKTKNKAIGQSPDLFGIYLLETDSGVLSVCS